MDKNIMITGGAGFIGSHAVRHFAKKGYNVIVVDSLTYAGNFENISDVINMNNVFFEKIDICDAPTIADCFRKHKINGVIHFAAESHVDRSISDPLVFVKTNVLGTITLLQEAMKYWKEEGIFETSRFHHVSTDEVYGSLALDGYSFRETDKYDPHSPYSASKASSDHFVRAFHDTYGMNVTISNCSNNYGPNQFPEKLIPLVINNVLKGKPIPLYGDGMNVRDWLYVEDHINAIDLIFERGKSGETYNIGGHNEKNNISLIWDVIDFVKELAPRFNITFLEPSIKKVTDRLGHDRRYAIDNTKITHLGWIPLHEYSDAMRKTVAWYLTNQTWVEHVTSGEYQNYYKKMYENE